MNLLVSLLIAFFSIVPAMAMMPKIALVNILSEELSPQEKSILLGKEVVELPMSNAWYEDVQAHQVDEIILKQKSGFVGLYTPGGTLVRPVTLNIIPDNAYYQQAAIPPERTVRGGDWQDFQMGYSAGGRIDPYRPMDVFQANHQQLAPGWGYGDYKASNEKSRKSIIMDFLAFAPLDTVTPFNYPGNIVDIGANVGLGYGLGAIPHIGGLALELGRAKRNNEQYNNLVEQRAVPYYTEQPVQYFNQGDPTNPMSRDPNFGRMYPMPQAFHTNFPDYNKKADYYSLHGQPLPTY